MRKTALYLLSICLMTLGCIRFGPGRPAGEKNGPYIDSLGLRASLARIDNVVDLSAGTLVRQALEVPGNTPNNVEQPDFFQSIEDDYQKYLKLFSLHKKGTAPQVRCDYDLLETFRAKVFDPQPFLNAILHTMTLKEITTLDYAVQSDGSDTLVLQVSWAKPTAQQKGKSFGITEGTLPLLITKHAASLAGPMLETLGKK